MISVCVCVLSQDSYRSQCVSQPPTPSPMSPSSASLSSYHGEDSDSISSPAWPKTPTSPVSAAKHNIRFKFFWCVFQGSTVCKCDFYAAFWRFLPNFGQSRDITVEPCFLLLLCENLVTPDSFASTISASLHGLFPLFKASDPSQNPSSDVEIQINLIFSILQNVTSLRRCKVFMGLSSGVLASDLYFLFPFCKYQSPKAAVWL